MARRQRETRTAHVQPGRQERRRILVVCGGRCTEPLYLEGLRRTLGSPSRAVKIVARPQSPERIVKYAADVLKSDDVEEIWCVFDVDEFDVRPAYEQARRSGVQLAVSNPCFELWLLLHFVDCRRPGVTPAQALDLLGKHIPGYAKNQLRFSDFAEGLDDAIKRARDLGENVMFPPGDPSTGMWKLVDDVFPSNRQEER